MSGEITGSVVPNEVVVIGGHLDSWDPGTGAIDDGAGVAITTAAVKLIGDLKRHPRRTLRVVMWGSEETNGASAAYLAAHKGDVANMVIASESDEGARTSIYSLQLPAGAMTQDQPQAAGNHPGAAPGAGIASEPALRAGSDVEGIAGTGVPVFSLSQDATRYFDYHHSADDTLAVVDPAQPLQNQERRRLGGGALSVGQQRYRFPGQAAGQVAPTALLAFCRKGDAATWRRRPIGRARLRRHSAARGMPTWTRRTASSGF